MARGTLALSSSDRGGTELPAPTVGDPTNGHAVANDGTTLLLVQNTGTTVARTVTLHISKVVDGITLTGVRTKSIPVGKTHLFGPYSSADYGTTILVDVDNAELKFNAIRSA